MQVFSRGRRNVSKVERRAGASRSSGRRLLPEVLGLEDRALLSLTIKIDYSFDSANFFDTQAKRDVVQAAADAVASALNDNLLAIQPSGGNTWTANFPNPTTGQQSTINNLAVPANTIIVYVGGRSLTGHSEAGEGSTGGFNATGSQSWLNLVAARGQAGALDASPTDFGPWGGSISFDNSGSTNWFFGLSTSGLAQNQTDFFTVAEHEVGHVLGFGTSPSWLTFVSGDEFVGPASKAAHAGVNVPLDPAAQHWAQGTTSDGVETVMDPSVANGTRKSFTSLDFAGLDDIGWTVQPPAPSSFSFNEPTYTVSEDAGSILIGVNRTGATGPATVQVATVNGTGQAGVHYSPIATTLQFAAGQTFQAFTVPIVSYNPAQGNRTFSITLNNPSSGGSLASPSAVSVNIVARGRHPLGDYDGVGFTQVGVFRVSTANWTVMDNGFGHSNQYGAGNLFDIPVPGDYDGVGRTEQAVFRPSTGQWFILNPLTHTQRAFSYGAKNLFDIPVPGDYDGIGRTEPAVFRPSTGQWIIFNPITNTQRVAFYGAGNLLDIPVPGDYDGIGRTELAVFRPSTARWAIYNPLTNTQRFINYGAGNLFDIPVPGDYDGVGRTELAVFRPSTGQWVILNPNTLGQRAVFFGATNYVDLPLQAPIASLKKLGKTGGNRIATRSAGAVMTATEHASMTAAATTSADPSVSGSSVSRTAAVVAIAPMPEPKLPAQGGEKSAWLEALEALGGGG